MPLISSTIDLNPLPRALNPEVNFSVTNSFAFWIPSKSVSFAPTAFSTSQSLALVALSVTQSAAPFALSTTQSFAPTALSATHLPAPFTPPTTDFPKPLTSFHLSLNHPPTLPVTEYSRLRYSSSVIVDPDSALNASYSAFASCWRFSRSWLKKSNNNRAM